MPYDVTSWFLEQAASPAPPIVRRYHLGYVKDQGPGGYDGVGIGGTLFVDGLTGEQAAAFDGKDDYLAIRALYYSDSGGAPYAQYPLTVEARFQAESVGRDMALLSFGHDRTYEVGLDAGGKAEFHMVAGALGLHIVVGTSTVNDGNTHAAAYRFDPSTEGGQLSIFVDGQLETQVVSQGTYWGGPGKAFGLVGRRFAGVGNPGTDVFNGTGSSNWFHGILDELRLWHVRRTDAEINSYHAVALPPSEAGSLVLWYDFDQLGEIGDRVVQWPVLERKWDDYRPTTAKVSLANDDGALNFLFEKPEAAVTEGVIQLGFTHPTSGDELISPFAGQLDRADHQRGEVKLSLVDKVQRLSNKVVGEPNDRVVYSGDWLPSDVAWDLMTTYGDFSDVKSTSNPDIDYASFQDWAQVFSRDSIFIEANFGGEKVTEAMRKLARHTQSAIYHEGATTRFHRFSAVSSESTKLGDDDLVDVGAQVDLGSLVTKQIVMAAYDRATATWGITTENVDSEGSVSYGLREGLERDENVWYVNSVSALNLAQRYTLVGGNPYTHHVADTILSPVQRQVGEIINLVDDQLGIAQGFRIMDYELNLQDGRMRLGINASQVETPFVLDVSTLDSDAKLL